MSKNTPEPEKSPKSPEPSGVDLARVALRAAKSRHARVGTRRSRRSRRGVVACAPARAPTAVIRWRSAPPSTG